MKRNLRPRAKLMAGAVFVIGALATLTGCDLQEDADIDRGRAIFTQKCGTCHALAKAGSTVNIGPNLDQAFAESRANGMEQDTIEGVVTDPGRYPAAGESRGHGDLHAPGPRRGGRPPTTSRPMWPAYAGVPGIEPPGRSGRVLRRHLRRLPHLRPRRHRRARPGPTSTTALKGHERPSRSQMSISDPNAVITPGYQPNVMPQNFGQTLQPDQLQALVSYLQTATGGGGGAAAGGGGGKNK